VPNILYNSKVVNVTELHESFPYTDLLPEELYDECRPPLEKM